MTETQAETPVELEKAEETAPSPPEREEREERPAFDLLDILKGRKRGEFATSEVLAYAILADIMDRREDRREERMWRRQMLANPTSKPSPEVEVLKAEVGELRKTVGELLETIRSQQQEKAQKEFVQGVVEQVVGQIMPELKSVKDRLDAFEKQAAAASQQQAPPPETSELREIRDSLKEITDKIGEKIGAKGLTLSDVEQLMNVIETLEKRIVKREGGGEVDYRTMAVSTLGELGKEVVSAWRDIQTAKAPSYATQPPLQEETPASAMQNIIKRQVQNYIIARMKAGATTINTAQAAQELGLTPGQVYWAYNQLMREGWFQLQAQKQRRGKVTQPEQSKPEAEATPETTAGAIEEGEAVFKPTEG